MLSFGLSLLGGCVAAQTAEAPALYFPAHSIYIDKDGARVMELKETPLPASTVNMAASAQHGIFIAENVIKTGTRAPGWIWGLITNERDPYYNSLVLAMCSKISNSATGHRTNVSWTSNGSVQHIGNQSSLYTSGEGLESPLFSLHLENGTLHIVDSFGGEVKGTDITLPFDIRTNPGVKCQSISWRSIAEVSYDFVVSSYRNEGLGVRQLTLPLRALPALFADSAIAVFEFQTQMLIEL